MGKFLGVRMKCRYCSREDVVKKGVRKNKHFAKQIYYCRECGRKFGAGILQKAYPSSVVFDAVSLYNVGYSLVEAAKQASRKRKMKVSKSTLGNWVKELGSIIRYSNIRGKVVKKYSYDNVIASKLFRHKGLTYNFKIHNNYFEGIIADFPHSYFEKDIRCSQLKFNGSFKGLKKEDNVCRLTELFLDGVDNNRKRHDYIEGMLLANDTSTVAVEVPVWFFDKKIGGVCGHIDLLQVRSNGVYVLDYKPYAAADKSALSQLYLYALGLSFRTGIGLGRMRCAWFDETDYFEFLPSQVYVDYAAKTIRFKGEQRGLYEKSIIRH